MPAMRELGRSASKNRSAPFRRHSGDMSRVNTRSRLARRETVLAL